MPDVKIINYATDSSGALLDPLPTQVYQDAATNIIPVSDQEASQSVTVPSVGTHTLHVIGDGSTATISADTAVGTGFGTAVPGTPVEIDITTSGTVTVSATGAPYNMMLLSGDSQRTTNLGPIFTNGTALSTDRIVYTHHQDNFSNSAMSLYAEVEVAGDGKIIGNFLERVAGDLTLQDTGANSVSLAMSTSNAHKVGLVVDATAGTMALYVDGTWSADQVYSGTLTDLSKAVELFVENKYPCRIRKLTTKLSADKSWVEAKAA